MKGTSYLQVVFFTYGGGAVATKDQSDFKVSAQIFAFRPICCLYFGPVSKEKTAFFALFGEMKKI